MSPAKPGVQRVRSADGTVETILTGTMSCDPVRRTAWGTIIVGEEAGPTTSPATPGGWLLRDHPPASDLRRDRNALLLERAAHVTGHGVILEITGWHRPEPER